MYLLLPVWYFEIIVFEMNKLDFLSQSFSDRRTVLFLDKPLARKEDI